MRYVCLNSSLGLIYSPLIHDILIIQCLRAFLFGPLENIQQKNEYNFSFLSHIFYILVPFTHTQLWNDILPFIILDANLCILFPDTAVIFPNVDWSNAGHTKLKARGGVLLSCRKTQTSDRVLHTGRFFYGIGLLENWQ